MPPTPGRGLFDAGGGSPSAVGPLQRALQDLALVFFVSAVVYVALVATGGLGVLLAWFGSTPAIVSGELFVFAVLLAVGFGLTGLHRWIQLSRLAERRENIREALEENRERLKRRTEEIERLSYAAAHNLREPLRMASNYLAMLERNLDPGVLDDEEQRYLREACDATARMESMVRSLLEYATVRPQAGTSQVTDAEEALEAALEGLFAHNPELEIVEIHRGELPTVQADLRDLEAVFVHLLENAIVHGGEEVTRIDITADTEDGEACIRVADDGVGIKPSLRERIFQAFQHNRGSSPTAGAGMGLALCRRLIERHEGSIRVEDADEGACFRIELPLAQAPVDGCPETWQA